MLAKSFIEGLREETENSEEVSVEELQVSSLNIGPCKGCFSCWKKTPGKCIIQDDMPMVIEKQLEANVIIWSFPLYYFNVPGSLKNLIDRQLPVILPFMSRRTDGYGSGSHERRYDISHIRNVIISTCGFYSAEGNYDSVREMFGHFLGKDNFTEIFCGQGELFHVPELSDRTGEYLGYVKEAGAEFAKGEVSEATKENLKTLLYPKEVFEQMADASWGVEKPTGEKAPEDEIYIRQMAAMYNKSIYDGKDRVLGMHFTDIDKSYQILLGKDGGKVYTDGSLTATTQIEVPFEIWKKISKGELGAGEALGKQMYTVTGDFSIMTSWYDYFGGGTAKKAKAPEEYEIKGLKRPLMITMLIPWMVFWYSISMFEPRVGSIVTLAVCSLIPLILMKRMSILWDHIAAAQVALLAVAVYFTGDEHTFTVVGYLVFGMTWIVSCFTKEPLTAAYVKYQYGGDGALKNLLFVKTNYILTAAWGILYVLTAGWTWGLRAEGLGNYTAIFNYIILALMGLFTKWFQKWYPAYVASGKGRKHG